ncbi:MAG: T9SS type A sorting domain-containing protein [Ignavibacteria bacterium]|nr:T9SS type A sorting domain-containing protein [Ignavibacteria bacterium]
MIKKKLNIINLSMIFLIVIICAGSIYSQTSAQISIPFQVYDNAGGQKILYFGLDQTATEGIDIQLGESDLPPFPPIGAFDARFILPKNNFNGSLSSWKDYRYTAGFPFSDTLEHRLKYQSAEGATIMYFSWELPPQVTGLLQDLVGGIVVNVPIGGSGVYELTNFTTINQLKLFIYYNNIVTGVEDENIKPITYMMEQNFPNPFNPSTTIKYSVQEYGAVKLSVYNLLGERVAKLMNETLAAGDYQAVFNAKELSSGVYIAKLESVNYKQTIKMILSK